MAPTLELKDRFYTQTFLTSPTLHSRAFYLNVSTATVDTANMP